MRLSLVQLNSLLVATMSLFMMSLICGYPRQDMNKLLEIDITGLSERHVAALEVFIDKFKKGALEHGDLQRGKRWTPDMLSERIDENFYAIFELLELLDGDNKGAQW
jgi:hypothetical protein